MTTKTAIDEKDRGDFAQGDRVSLTVHYLGDQLPAGSRGIVTRVDTDGSIYPITVDFPQIKGVPLYAAELEKL